MSRTITLASKLKQAKAKSAALDKQIAELEKSANAKRTELTELKKQIIKMEKLQKQIDELMNEDSDSDNNAVQEGAKTDAPEVNNDAEQSGLLTSDGVNNASSQDELLHNDAEQNVPDETPELSFDGIDAGVDNDANADTDAPVPGQRSIFDRWH